MTTLKIGDRVRLIRERESDVQLTIRATGVPGKAWFCVSDNGDRLLWAFPGEIELVEHDHDLKQAIREVLLSDEFLAAFARAWMNTPILHESDMNLEPTKEQPNESN